jgi:hypothetical protein
LCPRKLTPFPSVILSLSKDQFRHWKREPTSSFDKLRMTEGEDGW